MAYSLPPRDTSMDAFNFVLDVFDSGDGAAAAVHGDPSKGGGGLTETISFDDLLALPLPFDAGVYGVGQQSLLAAAQRRGYGAAALPRPASWAGPLESVVIAQGTVVPRKHGRAPPRRPPARKLATTREHAPEHAAADAEVAAANAAAARTLPGAPPACVPPRPSSAPPSLDAAPATAAEQTAAAEAGVPELTLAEVAAAGLEAPAAKRAASQAFLATLREHGGAGAPASGSKKPRDRSGAAGPPRRSSVYRGVTRHRWTGRFEAHLWDAASERAPGSTRGRQKGKQVYLGGYCTEEQAARAYDVAAIKYWGDTAMLNFEVEDYAGELEDIERLTTAELVAHLRRKSSGFSRGASKFRGVTRHHQHGRWEARIGRVMGNKYLYLGTFSSELEAARAYDRAAIRYRGARAVTNFNISEYAGEDLGAMPAGGVECGAAPGGLGDAMLMGADATMGAASADAMFEDFLSSQMGGHAMPMDAQMMAAGAPGGQHLHPHDDMVMMPGAMATHDFASFAHGGTGAWGFGL